MASGERELTGLGQRRADRARSVNNSNSKPAASLAHLLQQDFIKLKLRKIPAISVFKREACRPRIDASGRGACSSRYDLGSRGTGRVRSGAGYKGTQYEIIE